jgi:DNA-binding CsgD family transcriptional regulator
MLIRTISLPEINWLPSEKACATDLVKETLERARHQSILDALIFGTVALGFQSFVFGMVANDRRPDAESRAYIITNQVDEWVRMYDDRSYVETDPRIEMAGEPGYTYWEARQFHHLARHKDFLRDAAVFGIRSGLVLGLCTRNPPSYAMMALNLSAPALDQWTPERRLLVAGQAFVLGKVLSRSMREYLDEQELLFPAPPMTLNIREREILTLAASGKTSKAISEALGMSKITIDMHMGTILIKMGALNRTQAIAKAIANKLIHVTDAK